MPRAQQAFHLFARSKPIFDRQHDPITSLRITRLEARLLDGIECIRESEILFEKAFQGFLDAELYKDAYLTLLTLFEQHCKRGAIAKAAEVCRLALRKARQLEGAINLQIQAAWEQLLSAVELGQTGSGQLSGARQIFVQYWNIPPTKSSSHNLLEVSRVVRPTESQVPSLPALPLKLTPQTYIEAREAFDCALIAAAYRETGGNISETSRLLGLSRPTARKRLRLMGLIS